MKNMRDLLPEKYWDNVKDGKLVSDSWRVQTSSKYYDSHYNAHWGINCCESEEPEDFTVLQEFLTSLNPEFTYKQYLGLKNMINLIEDDYWDYYSKGQIYNYEIDCNKLLNYLTNVCGYNFD